MTPTRMERIDMANSNDAMDTVQHNVRILDEALVRLEGGDETAREDGIRAARKIETAARDIRTRLGMTWIDGGSGQGWPPADDPNHDPRD